MPVAPPFLLPFPITMADTLRVLCLGHSFVRRAQNFMQINGLGNLTLPEEHFTVQLLGRGGARQSDLLELFANCSNTPDLVILDIGTNDLVDVSHVSQAIQLADNVYQTAQSLLAKGVSRVIILEVLPRSTRGRHGAAQAFTTHARSYNRHIQASVQRHREHVPIFFWYHAGMSYKAEQFLSDGVHLNRDGNYKYIKSIKRAVITHRPALRPAH